MNKLQVLNHIENIRFSAAAALKILDDLPDLPGIRWASAGWNDSFTLTFETAEAWQAAQCEIIAAGWQQQRADYVNFEPAALILEFTNPTQPVRLVAHIRNAEAYTAEHLPLAWAHRYPLQLTAVEA